MRKCEEMLKNAMENGELAEVYSNRNDADKFAVALVLAMDDEYAALQLVTPYGQYDGICVRRLDEIYRVCLDSKYLEGMRLLWEPVDADFQPVNGTDLREQLLQFAMERELVVSIELLSSDSWDVQGFVQDMENGVEVSALTSYGECDGDNAFDLEDVTEIACDGEDERKLQRLAEMRE